MRFSKINPTVCIQIPVRRYKYAQFPVPPAPLFVGVIYVLHVLCVLLALCLFVLPFLVARCLRRFSIARLFAHGVEAMALGMRRRCGWQ
jgi:hypothetical protein